MESNNVQEVSLRATNLNLSVSSPPIRPSGKPGKFSTSVVVVSWPPAAMPFASQPSNKMGCSAARAVYTAAVCAAGPEPMIHTGVFMAPASAIAAVLWAAARQGLASGDANALSFSKDLPSIHKLCDVTFPKGSGPWCT